MNLHTLCHKFIPFSAPKRFRCGSRRAGMVQILPAKESGAPDWPFFCPRRNLVLRIVCFSACEGIRCSGLSVFLPAKESGTPDWSKSSPRKIARKTAKLHLKACIMCANLHGQVFGACAVCANLHGQHLKLVQRAQISTGKCLQLAQCAQISTGNLLKLAQCVQISTGNISEFAQRTRRRNHSKIKPSAILYIATKK